MSKKKALLIAGGVLLVAILGVGFFFGKEYFSEEFGRETFISGTDVSSLDLDAALEELQHPKEFVVSLKGTQEYKVDLKDCIQRQFSMNQIQDCKNTVTFWETMTGVEKKFNLVPESVSFQDDTIKKQLKQILPEANKKTVDAHFDSDYKLIPEVNGDEFDYDEFVYQLRQDVEAGKDLSYSISDFYKKPKFTTENGNIKKVSSQIKEMKKAKITYKFGKFKEVVDWKELKKHLEYNPDTALLTVKDKWIQPYVKKLAGKYDTYGAACQFKTTKDGKVKLNRGPNGWLMDQKKTVKQLKKLVKKNAVKTVEPFYTYTGGGHDKNSVGDTYIEVSINRQHIWLYKKGKKVMESDVVTGMMTRDRMTLTGIYQVYAKQRERYLGTIAVQGYHTLVHYWMPFNRGQGLHDATWRSRFGGTIYKGGGSHGCVNLPYSFAAKLYDQIPVGIPVVVY